MAHPVRRVTAAPPKPLLLFDGDCGFCRRWVGWFRRRTGDRVAYESYQSTLASGRFPEIPPAELEEAVHLVSADGAVYRGAAAVCVVLAVSHRWPLWIHDTIPGAARLMETGYRFVARHRLFFSRCCSPREE